MDRHIKATQLSVANTRSAEPNHASPPRVGVVLVEQGRAFDNSIAALDVNGRQQALLRRPDLNEIRFGIALPFNHHRVARAQEEPRADNKAKTATMETTTRGFVTLIDFIGMRKSCVGEGARNRIGNYSNAKFGGSHQVVFSKVR